MTRALALVGRGALFVLLLVLGSYLILLFEWLIRW